MNEKPTKEEQDAVKFAQLVREIGLRIVSPAYREMIRVAAQDRRLRYLAHIEAGFTEAQALQMCKD